MQSRKLKARCGDQKPGKAPEKAVKIMSKRSKVWLSVTVREWPKITTTGPKRN